LADLTYEVAHCSLLLVKPYNFVETFELTPGPLYMSSHTGTAYTSSGLTFAQ